MFADALGQHLAPFRKQQLGVAQAPDAIVRIKDDRGGHDRSEERTTADFVHARDQTRTRLPGYLLKLQRAMQTLEQTKLGSGRGKRFLGSECEFGRHELADQSVKM